MIGIHTIEFAISISSEEEKEIRNLMEEYDRACVYYDDERKRYVFDAFSDQGLRIFLWKRTNEMMHKERLLEYVLNLQAVLNGDVRYAFYGNERELELVLYRVEQMLWKAGLPGLKKDTLERMDFCIDVSYDCEKKAEEAMRLVRKHGIPRGYKNFYKGTSYNNRHSLEIVRNTTGERLVIYDKTHQLREIQVDVDGMEPTLRVEYKAKQNLRKEIMAWQEDMSLAEVIFAWRELAEADFKNMVDDLLTGGIHRKHDDLMKLIRQAAFGSKKRLSVREGLWMGQVISLFEILRNKNRYHETIRAYCAEKQSMQRDGARCGNF